MADLKLLQEKSYEALEQIDRLFKGNNIQYFLIAGTALGAVRHKGFIPWDDDIDIAIFYEDQEKVSHLLEKEMRDPYQWADIRTCKNFPRFFGKVLYKREGCIDIWPLVKTSNNIIGRWFQWSMRKILYKLYKAKLDYNIQHKYKKYLAKVISLLVSKKTIFKLVKKNENLFEKKEDSTYYMVLYGAHNRKNETIKSEWLYPVSYVNFEGGTYPSIGNLDEYLTNMYGNYMVPPDDNDRERRHGEKF